MKKILTAVLSLTLALNMGLSVYADKGSMAGELKQEEVNGKTTQRIENQLDNTQKQDKALKVDKTKENETVTEAVYNEPGDNQDDDAVVTIEYLREQFKQFHKDKLKRKELIKEIVRLRKENKDESTPVFINGKELVSEVPPVIKSGSTLIPVRAVTNALGAKVEWFGDTRTVVITKTVTTDTGEKIIKIEIKLDSDIILVNGTEVKVEVPAQLVSERTMVPLRFIAETFKQKVEWDADTGSVIIEDEDEDNAEAEPAPAETPEATPAPTPAPAQ